MARPSKLVPETADALVKLVESGSTLADAARVLELHPTTLRSWLRRGKLQRRGPFASFLSRIRQGQAKRRNELVRAIDLIGKGGAIAKTIVRRKRDGTEEEETVYATPQGDLLYKLLVDIGEGQYGGDAARVIRDNERELRDLRKAVAELKGRRPAPAGAGPDTRITSAPGQAAAGGGAAPCA